MSDETEAFVRSEQPCEVLDEERAEAILGGPVRAVPLREIASRVEREAEGDRTRRDLFGSHCTYRREDGDAEVMFRIHLRAYESEEEFAADWDDEESEPLAGVGWAAFYRSDREGADKVVTAMINSTQGIFTLGTYDAQDVSKEDLAASAEEIAVRYVGGCPPKCGR